MNINNKKSDYDVRLTGIWTNLTTFFCVLSIVCIIVLPWGTAHDARNTLYPLPWFIFMWMFGAYYFLAIALEYSYYGTSRCHVHFDESGITRYKKGNITLFRIAFNYYGGKLHYDWSEIKYIKIYRRDYSGGKISKKEYSYNFIEYPVYIVCAKDPLTEEEQKKIRKEVLRPGQICFPYNEKILTILKEHANVPIETEARLESAMMIQEENFDNKKKWKGTLRV